ncbi:hypothetical protein [uncultured Tyzzerella sp.]|uniref:FMN-binding protein n=1 Tax=uncultured Tyzzerella sp. TaxID=2321398 RepID=UPI0029436EF4|nr:hypothetical protein [uncultured Tyzzerella sp.]
MSTKIVVVKLRDIIKKTLLAIIGIVILGVIVYLFIPKNNTTAYNPGTYSSDIVLHSNPVSVQVTVSKNEILDINLVNMGETQEVFYPLFGRSIDDISAQIIENQSTDIKASVDNSMTTDILVKAIDKALEQAKK